MNGFALAVPVSFKDDSVKATRVHPEVFRALADVARCYEAVGARQLIVTSINDAQHRRGSLHYQGRAFDCRTKDLPFGSAGKRNLRDDIARYLGTGWDVILEDQGGPNEHLHLELQWRDTP